MPYPRCPHLDILSNQLIDTYRESAFGNSASEEDLTVSRNPALAKLIEAIREHKRSCLLCQKIAANPRKPPKIGKVA